MYTELVGAILYSWNLKAIGKESLFILTYTDRLFKNATLIVLPAKSDSDVMFCLQSYQGLRIDRSLVY